MMNPEPKRNSADRRSFFIVYRSSFIIFIPLAIYFALALPQLNLPGLHNDEAAEAGLQAMQILSGQPIAVFRGAGIEIGGRTFPLMVQDYIGAFNVYFVLPFFAAFGNTVTALRLYTVLIGAVTLAITFGLVTEAVSKRAAFIAAILLAASPSFIFWQRQGVFVASLTATFTVAALWTGTAWAKRGGWKWAALLGLLCGAGLYAKLLFVWVIGGAVAALAILNLPAVIRYSLRSRPHLRSLSRRERGDLAQSPSPLRGEERSLTLFPRTATAPDLIAFTLAILLALTPLFVYNIQTGGTFLSVGANLTTSYYGVNNLNFAENLRARIDHFRAVIAGSDHLWYLGGSFENGMWEPALTLAALVIIGRWLFRRQRSRLPVAILLLLIFGIVQSSFTVSGLFPTHFAIFTPLWPIVVALACETIFDPFYEPIFIHLSGPNLNTLSGGWVVGWLGFVNMGMVVLAVGVTSLFARDVIVTSQYHAALNQSGGLGPHSDAVYRLTDWLKENAPEGAPVVAMDWGFAPQVKMLTGGGIVPQEVFGYTWEPDEGFADRLNPALDTPGTLFIFHFPQETIFPRREQFDALVKERGWQVEQLVIISRRDGAPMFEIARVVKP
jgi:4-amino-4-deoxy-L-arabinose transferase-like glycosyltransferase